MSIQHRLAKVRAHLPADIEVRGFRSSNGDSIAASNGKRTTLLFISAGSSFSPKQAAANFAAQLGGGAA